MVCEITGYRRGNGVFLIKKMVDLRGRFGSMVSVIRKDFLGDKKYFERINKMCEKFKKPLHVCLLRKNAITIVKVQ